MLIPSIGGTSQITMDALKSETTYTIMLNDGDRTVEFDIPEYLFDALVQFENERIKEDN